MLVSGLFFLTTAPFPFVPAFPMMGESTWHCHRMALGSNWASPTAAGSSTPMSNHHVALITPCGLLVAESNHQSVACAVYKQHNHHPTQSVCPRLQQIVCCHGSSGAVRLPQDCAQEVCQ